MSGPRPDVPVIAVCSRCGARIDPREPAWIERADGTLAPSSERTVASADRASSARVWHLVCRADEFAA
jgi:hypothetical protein